MEMWQEVNTKKHVVHHIKLSSATVVIGALWVNISRISESSFQ